MKLERLYSWYAEHHRKLSFRGQNDPYKIWISEVMLQQTRVEAMLPLYEKFVARFPDVESLASAHIEEVLDAWRGLGYYTRARNLHRGARYIQTERSGRFPGKAVDLLLVPGIGPYTSAAVASISFGEPVAVVDGNVRRVLTRLLGRQIPARTAQEEADRLMALRGETKPAVHNQAMMELGSLVCTPRSPRCSACPLSASCKAGRHGPAFAESLTRKDRPSPIAVEMEVFVIRDMGGLWLLSDQDSPFLSGQWFFPVRFATDGPGLEDTPGKFPRRGRKFPPISHTITKYKITIVPVEVESRGFSPRSESRFQWKKAGRAEAHRLVVSSAGSKVLRALDP